MNPNASSSPARRGRNLVRRVFGIDHFDVSAHANACSPCSSTPVDIVIALDRTGSMCHDHGSRRMHRSRQRQGRRPHDAGDAQPALRADRHGGVPAGADDGDQTLRGARNCSSERLRRLRHREPRLRDRPINSDYKAAGGLNPASGLSAHRERGRPPASGPAATPPTARRCARPRPSSRPRAPQRPRLHRLPDRRRGQHRQRLRVDTDVPAGNADDQQPCQTAIDLANATRRGTTIYSIGYALGNERQLHGGRLRPVDARRRAPSRSGGERPSRWRSPRPLVRSRHAPRRSRALATVTPRTAGCYHKADVSDESPTIYSDDTVRRTSHRPARSTTSPTAAT